MATYKESVGTAVRDIAGEDGIVTGQLWYDTDANEYKYRQQFKGSAWSTGNSMNTARNYHAGAGTQTAALAFNGEAPPPTTKTEAYDGTSWTEVNDMNVAKEQRAGAGTQTSALCCGGASPVTAETESWDGTNWTEVSDLNTARLSLAQAGVSNTSSLAFGGRTPQLLQMIQHYVKVGMDQAGQKLQI